jgi:GNAT superfamily N-acetyltransferase
MALFQDEFPPETREPDAELIAEVDGHTSGPRYRYWAWVEGERLMGFVRATLLPETLAHFVIHIVTRSEARGKGVGSALLAHVRNQAPGVPVVCEVEPGEAMRWWTARGGRTLTPTYTQPALRPDTEPVPFHLVVIGSPADGPTFVQSFYREVWRLPEGHPFVARAVAGILEGDF